MYVSFPSDESILAELESRFHYSRDYAVQCLKNNRHNQVTTTYYLMLKKRDRDGTLPLPIVPPSREADPPAQTPRLPDGDQGAGNGRPVPKLDLVGVKPGATSVEKALPAGMHYSLNPPTFRVLQGR